MRKWIRPLLAVAVLETIGAMGIVRAETPAEPVSETQQLHDEVVALRSRVAELEARQVAKVDVDATVDSVLRDADQRSQFLATDGGMTGGYDNGKFFLRSANGDFSLHPWFQFQFRSVTNWAEDGRIADGGEGEDNIHNGFEVRRMKFGVDGNVFGKDMTYLFLWATDRNSGSFNLEEAWAKYMFADGMYVTAGQFKDPFAHESLVSSKKLMAAERTLLTDTFTGGDNFVQGVALTFDDKGPVRASTAFTDGANEANRNFLDFPVNKADFGAAARIEWLATGNWASYDDFSAMGNKEDLVVIGAGADWTQSGDTNILLHTVDAQAEFGQLGLFAAYYGRYIMDAPASSTNPPTVVQDLYDFGFVVQASYSINEHWEPFARYDFINFDEDGVGAGVTNQVNEIAVGVNYYFHGHNSKFTLDATYLPDGTPVADSGADILANDGDEILIRAQFQLLL